MPRRPAAFTKADIARLIRGARDAGAAVAVVEMPSGVKFSIPLDKNFKVSDIMGNACLYDDDEEAAFTI